MNAKNIIRAMACSLAGIASVLPVQTEAQVKARVLPVSDWVWYAPEKPQIDVVVKDSLLKAVDSRLTLVVTTDTHRPVCTMSQQVRIARGDSAVLSFSPLITEPGFYNCQLLADGKPAFTMAYQQYAGAEYTNTFRIGYEPERIISLPDAEPDFKAFWDKARAELAAVEPHYSVTEWKEKGSKVKKAYVATMLSLGGDTVRVYYTVPVKKGRYPVHVVYMGYDSGIWDLDNQGTEWIDAVVSVRGQAMNKPHNRYGDWIVSGLESPEQYYYRGAYMDCVRALDFICTLPQADTLNIFAEGGSQGGAFTMATAALDRRLRAVACYITFMSDFPDYLQMVPWPADKLTARQHELKMSDTDLYRTLSYFDIKNLARWIECPVYLASGLQDPTCPPHTNFSGFNLVRAPKAYHIFRDYGHHVDYSVWNPAIYSWYERWKKR